jgi:alanyl-tRNA synthetase
METTAELRTHFLDYFARHDHKVVPSSSLVPQNDPTLMFTTAGMVQFKNVFTGLETRPYTKATSAQKCVRAGGKHNDLENVGHTARHHTFFEMLGNFSFGDYFKAEAIELAWTLFTKELAIPKDRLLVTVYSEDEEAARLWNKIAGIPDEKIIRIATTDNFWSAGDTGPCGPCSEIFYDHGSHIPGGPPGSPDEDGDRFVELWNLVFMQYLIPEPGAPMVPLPKPSIDTGSGLERVAAVMQGVHNNYDIDLFKNLIHASQHVVGREAKNWEETVSHRVIADHLRSSCFLMADGVMPSNEGRGYVLRRIMRRGMRHAHILGCENPIMYKLVPALVKEMGDAYPELVLSESLLMEALEIEETRFKQTLGRGLRLLKEETDKLGKDQTLPGDVAFKLYDTFGFPLDLTEDVLKEENRTVDLVGFQTAMNKQKADARASWAGSGDQKQESVWFELLEKFGPSEFLGYATPHAEGNIIALVRDGKQIESAEMGDVVAIVTNQTPFYGESGGQMGDTGIFKTETATIQITDTVHKVKSLTAHLAKVTEGSIHVSNIVDMLIDGERRTNLRANHSATHLLHSTLRHQIGSHIVQKGSLVAPDRLRFDYSHNSPLTAEQIKAIENDVNARIRLNTDVRTRLMSPEQAQETGAMALFGEKYEDEVRVVSMGGTFENSKNAEKEYSLELCGGTHVQRTGEIGLFKILTDTGIASGIRRIEALTGQAALEYVQDTQTTLTSAAMLLKSSPEQIVDKLDALLHEKKRLEKDVKSLQQKMASGGSKDSEEIEVQDLNGVKFLHRTFEDIPANDLKPIADQLKKQLGSGIVMLTSISEGKVSVVIGVTQDKTDTYNAVDYVRMAAEALGGKGGGGRPDMAQAGGALPDQIPAAVDAVATAIVNTKG